MPSLVQHCKLAELKKDVVKHVGLLPGNAFRDVQPVPGKSLECKVLCYPAVSVKIHLWGTAITGWAVSLSMQMRRRLVPPTTGKAGKGGIAL